MTEHTIRSAISNPKLPISNPALPILLLQITSQEDMVDVYVKKKFTEEYKRILH